MQRLTINSFVRVQKSREYGKRFVFVNNALNPRDELGKYGVTVYESYLPGKSFEVKVKLCGKNNDVRWATRYVNRESLGKYLHAIDPTFNYKEHTDEELIQKLNDTSWKEKLNEKNTSTSRTQARFGAEGLRHAGMHNQQKLSGFFRKLSDSIVGKFFSLLYKLTVRTVTTLKMRFLFINTEKDYFNVSEALSNERFRDASNPVTGVPAYQTHLNTNNFAIDDNTKFSDIPATTKDNLIKPAIKTPWLTHLNGQLPDNFKIDTSTGTTGTPTVWHRSSEEIKTVKRSMTSMGRLALGNRKLYTINTFALGAWATGLSVHEIARENGSIFSPGGNLESTLQELQRNYSYEQFRLEKVLSEFKKQSDERLNKRPDIDSILRQHVNNILTLLLKNPQLTVDEAIDQVLLANSRLRLPEYAANFKRAVETLNSEKRMVMVTGYPPFLLELTRYAQSQNVDFKRFNVTAMAGGQAISEPMRREMEAAGFLKVYSSFGASDLDINIGLESDTEITLRRTLEENPGMVRELFGANQGIPMVFRFDPLNYNIECDSTNNHLIMTCNRDNRSSPRVRYDIQDNGRVYAASDIQAMLTKYGIFKPELKFKHNLPFLFVWGRESTVGYGKVNVPFSELEGAVQDIDTDNLTYKRAFYSYEVNHKPTFDIWLELNDDEDFPKGDQAQHFQALIIKKMADKNEYFADEISKLADDATVPDIVLFKRGKSPIAEPGGQRKQVLIFKNGVNFSDSDFPNDSYRSKLTKRDYEQLCNKPNNII